MQRIPKTMRAMAIDRFGGPQVLTLHELPVPVPEGREVLIALDTAGVGSWDADMRDGLSGIFSRSFERSTRAEHT